jgi:hypothetical protein
MTLAAGRVAVLAAVLVACGACGRGGKPAAPAVPTKPQTLAERALGMLPDGAQIVIELDLARLRANAVVGEVATRVFADVSIDNKLPGLPGTGQGSAGRAHRSRTPTSSSWRRMASARTTP